MSAPNVPVADLLAEVERAKGLKDSVKAFIAGVTTKVQKAVADAVTAALAEDDASDEAVLAAANEAIAKATADLAESNNEVADALAANAE